MIRSADILTATVNLTVAVFQGSTCVRTIEIAHQHHVPTIGDVIEYEGENLGRVSDRSFRYVQPILRSRDSDHAVTVLIETELPPE